MDAGPAKTIRSATSTRGRVAGPLATTGPRTPTTEKPPTATGAQVDLDHHFLSEDTRALPATSRTGSGAGTRAHQCGRVVVHQRLQHSGGFPLPVRARRRVAIEATAPRLVKIKTKPPSIASCGFFFSRPVTRRKTGPRLCGKGRCCTAKNTGAEMTKIRTRSRLMDGETSRSPARGRAA